jgi:hypothetical protein
MRIRIVLGVGLAALMAAASCGSDGGDGRPGTGGSSNSDAGPDEEPAPEPGVCHKLCCSADDCESSETCKPFNPSYGTLGTCSGTGWGLDAGSGDPDAGTGTTLPAGCWTLNQAPCNPVTNEGCTTAGHICDFSAQEDQGNQSIIDCYDPSGATQGAGEDCESVDGPFCIPGFHCVPS